MLLPRAPLPDDAKEKVRDAVDFVAWSAPRPSCAARPAAATWGCARSTTSGRRRSPSTPARSVFHCFGCGGQARPVLVIELTEGVDFVGALELLADRHGIELEVEDEDPAAAERRRARDRLLELLERTARFYERMLWEWTRGRAGAEVPARPRAVGGDAARVPRRLRAERVGQLFVQAARRRASRLASSTTPAWPLRARGRGRMLRPLPRPRDVPAVRPARPGARLRRASARRRTSSRSTSTRRTARPLPQGRPSSTARTWRGPPRRRPAW